MNHITWLTEGRGWREIVLLCMRLIHSSIISLHSLPSVSHVIPHSMRKKLRYIFNPNKSCEWERVGNAYTANWYMFSIIDICFTGFIYWIAWTLASIGCVVRFVPHWTRLYSWMPFFSIQTWRAGIFVEPNFLLNWLLPLNPAVSQCRDVQGVSGERS